MPRLTFPIDRDGLIPYAYVSVSASQMQHLVQTAQPIPSPIRARALIDSGALTTSLDPGILAQLGTASLGQATLTTASGVAQVNRYAISLSIFGPASVAGPSLVIPDLLVSNFAQQLGGIEVLIGMDVLKQIILIVDGPRAEFTLEF